MQWCPGLRRFPQAHKIPTLPVCAQGAGFLPCSGSTARILEVRIIYLSSWQLLILTPVLGDCFTAELFLLWFLPKKSRKAGSGGWTILIFHIFALCFEVQWFHTATKLAHVPFSPTPLQSSSPQSGRHYKKKKIVSVPTNCDRIISKSFSVGFSWMKLCSVL